MKNWGHRTHITLEDVRKELIKQGGWRYRIWDLYYGLRNKLAMWAHRRGWPKLRNWFADY